MHVHRTQIHPDEIQLSRARLLLLFGNQQEDLKTFSLGLLDQSIRMCKECMQAQGAWVEIAARAVPEPDQIAVAGLKFNCGKMIHSALKGARDYVFFLVTAGEGPEMLARKELEKGNYPEAYMIDLVASAIVDLAAAFLSEQIRQMADSRGLKITNRYSPGYCSWDVSEQKKLFRLFPPNCCGITLESSSMMKPIKSISAVMAMGPDVSFQKYTCQFCPMKDCAYRDLPSA